MKARTLLVRGMLVGVVAGLLTYGFSSLFGEPQINNAIGYEAAHTAAGMGEPESVSRSVQSTIGLAVALVVYGAALGGIFALAFASVYGRFGRHGIRATALAVAGAGFTTVSLAPFVKYPANPPAVGDPQTIDERTALYWTMILVCVLAAVAATLCARALLNRLSVLDVVLVGVGTFVLIVGIAMVVLPGVDEVPADFPATTLWRFRLASLGSQAVLWATFGLLFGALTARSVRRHAGDGSSLASAR